MQTPHTEPAAPARRSPLRVYCAACHHTEFVHCDVGERTCLYSECGCGGFAMTSAA